MEKNLKSIQKKQRNLYLLSIKQSTRYTASKPNTAFAAERKKPRPLKSIMLAMTLVNNSNAVMPFETLSGLRKILKERNLNNKYIKLCQYYSLP